MLITLGGKAGSGKGTASKLLQEKLGYEIVSIGDMKRKLAAEMGLNIQEFNKLWDDPKNAQEFDLKYEEFQKGLSLKEKIILDSRLGFYAQPEAFKILLDVDEEEAGKRIFAAQRGTDQFKNEEEAVQNVKERNQADADRYVRLYDLQVWDYKNYSLVIDTTERTPEEVVEIILKEFEARKQKKLQENPKLYGFLKEEIKENSDKENSEGKPEKEDKSECKERTPKKKNRLKIILLTFALALILGLRIGALLRKNPSQNEETPSVKVSSWENHQEIKEETEEEDKNLERSLSLYQEMNV